MKKTIAFLLFISLSLFATTYAQVKKKGVKAKPQRAQPTPTKSGNKPKLTEPVPPRLVRKDTTKIPGQRIRLVTDSGTMVLRLYDKTPLHRDNFIKLAKERFFDSILFHRVIPGFMIQGGDPDSKRAMQGQMLGNGGPGYNVPAEFDSTLFHKRGALAAARQSDQVNPKKESSGSQFYIVHGKVYTAAELDQMEARTGRKIPAYQREYYMKNPGTPSLDMNYTVFGEMESGFEVIDKIANAVKDPNNRPYNNISMKIELIK